MLSIRGNGSGNCYPMIHTPLVVHLGWRSFTGSRINNSLNGKFCFTYIHGRNGGGFNIMIPITKVVLSYSWNHHHFGKDAGARNRIIWPTYTAAISRATQNTPDLLSSKIPWARVFCLHRNKFWSVLLNMRHIRHFCVCLVPTLI